MRISDWSSDVCSSDLALLGLREGADVRHDNSPCSLFPSRDHRSLDGDRKAGDDRRRLRLRTEAQRRMPGGQLDRQSVVSGKSVSVRVDLGGRRIITKKQKTTSVQSPRTDLSTT